MDKQEILSQLNQKIKEASTDPILFIDRFLYTFDPKREPYNLPFELFDFQKDLVLSLVEAINQGYDLFIEKCREMGATYTTLAVFLWFWLYIPGSNFLLGSRKEDAVDNRGSAGRDGVISNKEESLFGKLDYMLNHLPQFILPQGYNYKKHNTYMSLINPANGNVISGESANPNFSRAGRFKAVLMDEFAFWDNDVAAWGATADTTRCRIVLTTPGIRPSKAKRLRFGQDGEEIRVTSLTYDLDPRKTQEWLENERKRRSNEDFAREIMINWETAIQGRVYEEIKYAEVGLFHYNPMWGLYVSWDFGLDGTAIGFWQPNLKNGKMRLIDSYFNSDKPIEWFLPLFDKPIDSTYLYTVEDLEAINTIKQFKKAVHYGDPDVAKRSYLTGVSTREILENNGIYVQTNSGANDFLSRRDRTKVMLQKGIEVNDTPRNRYWMECMQNARYPQRQETSQAGKPITLPIHDWTSHHRTATEYLAVNYEPGIIEIEAERQQAPNWYSPSMTYNRPGAFRRHR